MGLSAKALCFTALIFVVTVDASSKKSDSSDYEEDPNPKYYSYYLPIPVAYGDYPEAYGAYPAAYLGGPASYFQNYQAYGGYGGSSYLNKGAYGGRAYAGSAPLY